MTPNETPTAEADAATIQELFARDPENLSDQDIDAIVSHYRKKRHIFLQEENTKKAKGSSRGRKDAPKNLSLDDLLA